MTAQISPLRALIQQVRPDLADEPNIAGFVDTYESLIGPEQVAVLSGLLPRLTAALEADDYLRFRDALSDVGYGDSAPYLYAALQEFRT